MAGTKKASQPRGITKTRRRSTSAKAAPLPTAASPSRQRRPQARSGAPGNQARPKPARGGASPRRKTAMVRSAGEMDSALAARLETIAQGLGQITELRAEVEALRAIVEKLVQTVSALTPNRQDEARAPEEAPPTGTEEVPVVETYGVSAAEEEQPELEGVA
jgi:uncharacterized coiled-coil protein SlyX